MSSKRWRVRINASLAQIASYCGGVLVRGDSAQRITGVATLETAGLTQVSFLAHAKYRNQLRTTGAGAVVLEAAALPFCPQHVAAIVSEHPYLAYAKLTQLLHAPQHPAAGVHPTAVVESVVPESVAIAAHVYVGPDVVLGEHVVLEAGCSIAAGVTIEANSWLHHGVRVYPRSKIGARCTVHANSVIGADGFGYAPAAEGRWTKIEQIGRAIIDDDCEIGANTCIDRGALGDTVIGAGVKIDNLVQIAHNVRIGEHTAIAGCVGIAGSTSIGKRCRIGGAAMIIGHLHICDEVTISAGTFVGKSITAAGQFSNSAPLLRHAEWLHNFSHLRHLEDMADKIHNLEARLLALEHQ